LGDPGSDDRQRPDPVEQALEVFVYAPLGLLLEAHRLWPEVVERGRREVDNSRDWIERRVRNAVGEAESALRGLGLVPSPADPPRDPVKPTLVVAPDPPATPAARAPTADPPREQEVDVELLAIPGYDSLSASQVVPRLAGLAPEELELVRKYELGGRGRRTILSRIAQLQDPS
jgi:hypothetical protein